MRRFPRNKHEKVSLWKTCLSAPVCWASNANTPAGSNALPEETIEKLRTRYRLIPVCPETAGGLPTPRDPSERLGERVVSCRGADVTAQFKKGAEAALTLARRYGCTTALMKEHSPSCGSGLIYDGSFSGKLVKGDGMRGGASQGRGRVCGRRKCDRTVNNARMSRI